jgi:hypothetical protein
MKVELSDHDAQLFLEFQKDYVNYSVLKESGVFDIRNGIAQLNFNAEGTVTDIECNFKLYKRGYPVLVNLHITE